MSFTSRVGNFFRNNFKVPPRTKVLKDMTFTEGLMSPFNRIPFVNSDFLKNTVASGAELVSPYHGAQLFNEGLNDMRKPLGDLNSGNAFKSWSDFGQFAGEFPSNTLLGGAFLYSGLKPNRPDLDAAGPMEEAASRLSDVYLAVSTLPQSQTRKYGLLPSILGAIGASNILDRVGKGVGRMADKHIGALPTPQELNERFMSRIAPAAKKVMLDNPGISENAANQYATMQLLQQVPDYFERMGMNVR